MKKGDITILYVEDEESLGFIVSDSLEERGYNVIFKKDGEEGWDAFCKQKPDICVLDVMMPKKDGLTLATDIRAVDKDVPIIFLTAKSQPSDVVKGFELGADDYLKKPFSIEELIVRINARLTKNTNSSDEKLPTELIVGKYTFNTVKQTLTTDGFSKVLTHRECELLKLLVANKNDVLERKIVLDKIWGDDSFFNARSMDVFITKLRKYLVLDTDIQIINVRGVGYKLICE